MDPMEMRLAEAVTGMLGDLSDEEWRERAALVQLDPDGPRGVTLNYVPEHDVFEVSWAGRPLGAVSRPWLIDGDPNAEVPAP